MREQILEKASQLFIMLGFKSVTMDDLANEMGISKKTIYQFFKNKEELVHETSLFMFEKISDGIDAICELDKNAVAEMVEVKDFVMQYLQDEKNASLHQLAKFYPETYKHIREKEFEKMKECIVRNIKKGIAQGLYREDIHIGFITRMYFQGVFSIKDLDIFPSEIFESKSLQELYLDYHLRALVTPKGLLLLKTHLNKNH